ncbi:MAG: prenyltransferase [Myxococcales bacterium]|nr:prenyltransferase [Myxococcales bacterium]
MHPAFLPLSRRCLYALKPASWPKLLVPAALGQVLGVLAADQWSWGGAAVGLGFTLAALAYIVLLNDWFDVRVDAIKRQMFPDAGSPKTIPDAILHPQTVLLAGIGAGLCAAATGLCGELMVGRVGLGLAGVALLGLLLVYSAPPLRWNERGLGEVVEAVGVGAMLPWFNAYAQSGQVAPIELLLVLPGTVALALASAIASGLADEESDRAGAKVTITTELGNAGARSAVEHSVMAGAVMWALAARAGVGWLSPFGFSAALAVLMWQWREVAAASPYALTNAFPAIARYKQALHRAIWGSSLMLALVLLLLRLLGVG